MGRCSESSIYCTYVYLLQFDRVYTTIQTGQGSVQVGKRPTTQSTESMTYRFLTVSSKNLADKMSMSKKGMEMIGPAL
jgi:hypothetical protein